MNKPCLVAYVSDLYFQSQIEGVANSKKLDFYFASQGESLSELVKNFSASLLIVDLTEPNLDWLFKHISEIINCNLAFPVIAFISHVQETVRERAEKYGCYKVFTKSQFIKELPSTIEEILRKGRHQ